MRRGHIKRAPSLTSNAGKIFHVTRDVERQGDGEAGWGGGVGGEEEEEEEARWKRMRRGLIPTGFLYIFMFIFILSMSSLSWLLLQRT